MLFDTLPFDILLSRAIVLVIAFTIHEFAHAWTANYFGDPTPRQQGRLTLNPLKHLDPIGSLALLVAGFGWAKPVVINPMILAQAAPSALMLVSLAGPLSNLALAIVGALPFWFGLQPNFTGGNLIPSLGLLATEFVWINLILLFFNLIPLAPLDGEKVAIHFLPEGARDFFLRIRPYSSIILLGIVFLLPQVLQVLVGAPANFLFNLLARR